MKNVAVVFIFSILSYYSQAQGFLYQKSYPNESKNYEKYVKNISVMPDSTGDLDFEQIGKLERYSQKFIPKDSIPLAMPEVNAYWIKFKLKKPIDSNLVILLNPAYTLVEYYKPSNNKSTSSTIERAGFSISQTQNGSKYTPDIVFQLFSSDTSEWHYFRIKPFKEIIGLGFSVFPSSILIDIVPSNYSKFGLFYGLIMFAFIFNIILFYQLRQWSYLYYSLYTIMFGLYVMVEWQHFEIFKLVFHRFTYMYYSFPFMLMTVFLLLYINSFFPNEKLFYNVRKASLYIVFIRIILYVVAYSFDVHTFFFSLWVDMICISVPFMLILFHIKQYKPARYLALAMGLIFLGYASHFDLINKTEFLRNTFTIQNLGVLELLLLSFALGSRIKAIEADRLFSQDLLMVELREKQIFKDNLNLELEEKVKHRTEEINELNQILKNNNFKLETKVESLVNARVMQEYVSLDEFKKVFTTDEVCYSFLAELKWKNGFTCRFCQSNTSVNVNKPHIFTKRCLQCSKIESPTADTIFHKLKFPIEKAFYIVFLVHTGKKITYEQLAQEVDLRVATCFAFKKKLIEVMEIKKAKKIKLETWSDLILP